MKKGPSGEMPFLDHLEELRYRLLWSIGALVVCVVVAFSVVWQYDVIGWLSAPIQPYLPEGKLVYTGPVDPFTIILKVAFGVGFIAALPIIGYHVWSFLSPALHRSEKKVMVPMLLGATVLFAIGVYLCVKWVLPASFSVLLTIQSAALEPMLTAREYFSFAVSVSLACGAVFQLPIVIVALTMLGLVNPSLLTKFRRHAAVGSLLLAAIITPGDMFLTTVMIGVPLYALYEISIVLSWFVYRAKLKRARAREAAERIGGPEA